MRRTLDGWLQRQSAKAARIVTVEDALLAGRFRAYAGYRLRYFLARYLVASVVYGVKFLLLFSIFSQDFLTILRVHAASALLATFWWGALETLREEVRILHRSARSNHIPAAVGRWLRRAGRTARVVLAGTAAWVLWRVVVIGEFGPADLFLTAIGVRLAAGIMTRTYHSGIYAIRRVYRPLSVMIGADVSSFVGTLLLWPLIGPWSFPLASILSSVAFTAVTLIYTARAYRMLGLAPRHEPRRRPPPEAAGLARTLLSGASFAVLRLDALLVLFLFHGRTGTGAEAIAFTLFFVLGPTVRAGFEWAQLFYFDLKKLEVGLTRGLRRRLERRLAALSWGMGALFWTIAAVAGTVIFQRDLGALYPLSLAFFLVRARLAVAQIRAFADERYLELLASGAACAAGFFLAGLTDMHVWTRLGAATGAMSVAGAVLVLVQRRRDRGVPSRHVVSLAEWIDDVSRRGGPMVVGAARFWTEPDDGDVGSARVWHEDHRWRYRQLAQRIARRLKNRGRSTLMLPDRILWWEDGQGTGSVDRGWVARNGGGHVDRIDMVSGPDGIQAMARAAAEGLLGPAGIDAERSRGGDWLLRDFHRRFRNGIAFSLESDLRDGSELTRDERQEIMADAVRFARESAVGRSRCDVTAFCSEGEIRQIFVLPPGVPPLTRARWRHLVSAANIGAALERRQERELAAAIP